MSLHIDGFDQFQDDSNAAGALVRAGYTLSGAAPVIALGRVAGSGLLCVNGGVAREVSWLSNRLTVGFAGRVTGRGSLCWLDFGDDVRLVLWLSPDDGQPRINDAVCGSLPVLNVWYYFELTLNRSAGTAQLYVNNRLDGEATLSAEMTAATVLNVNFGTLPPADYRPGVEISDNGGKSIDDIYIRDGVPLGPIAIKTRFPSLTGSSDWTSVGGSEHAVVSTTPPEPMDKFVAADEIGDELSFLSTTLLPNDNPIVASGLAVLVRKAPNLDARLRGFIGDGATVTMRDETVEVGANWEMQYLVFEGNPADTKEGMEDAPFGVEVVSS